MFFRLREMLARFFYGRCGMDRLNLFLFLVYFVLWFIGNILSLFSATRPALLIVSVINFLLLVIIIFRALSKNIYKRQSENLKFLNLKQKALAHINLQKTKWQLRKTHVFKTCPNCKATIKLPRKKGRHTCCCPKCKIDFKVRV